MSENQLLQGGVSQTDYLGGSSWLNFLPSLALSLAFPSGGSQPQQTYQPGQPLQGGVQTNVQTPPVITIPQPNQPSSPVNILLQQAPEAANIPGVPESYFPGMSRVGYDDLSPRALNPLNKPELTNLLAQAPIQAFGRDMVAVQSDVPTLMPQGQPAPAAPPALPPTALPQQLDVGQQVPPQVIQQQAPAQAPPAPVDNAGGTNLPPTVLPEDQTKFGRQYIDSKTMLNMSEFEKEIEQIDDALKYYSNAIELVRKPIDLPEGARLGNDLWNQVVVPQIREREALGFPVYWDGPGISYTKADIAAAREATKSWYKSVKDRMEDLEKQRTHFKDQIESRRKSLYERGTLTAEQALSAGIKFVSDPKMDTLSKGVVAKYMKDQYGVDLEPFVATQSQYARDVQRQKAAQADMAEMKVKFFNQVWPQKVELLNQAVRKGRAEVFLAETLREEKVKAMQMDNQYRELRNKVMGGTADTQIKLKAIQMAMSLQGMYMNNIRATTMVDQDRLGWYKAAQQDELYGLEADPLAKEKLEAFKSAGGADGTQLQADMEGAQSRVKELMEDIAKMSAAGPVAPVAKALDEKEVARQILKEKGLMGKKLTDKDTKMLQSELAKRMKAGK